MLKAKGKIGKLKEKKFENFCSVILKVFGMRNRFKF